jgi:hypothetical protein
MKAEFGTSAAAKTQDLELSWLSNAIEELAHAGFIDREDDLDQMFLICRI